MPYTTNDRESIAKHDIINVRFEHNVVETEMNNAQLSEWLARGAEAAEPRSLRARALRRAGRAALTWPNEVSELAQEGVPLTSLHRVGPYVAAVTTEVMARNDGVEPDPIRAGFLTRSRVTDILRGTPLRDAVRADFHVHTTWSDGHATLGAMADEAARLGRTHIVITDPWIDVLARPRGRIFNFRIGLSARWEVVFAEAAEAGIASERIINTMSVDDLRGWTASRRLHAQAH